MKKVAVLLLAGCLSLAPKYERPALPVPNTLPGGAGSSRALSLAEFVRDPKLREVLARVAANNRTLRRAVYDVEAARQVYRVQRAARLPQIDASASAVYARQFIGIPGQETIDVTEYQAGAGLATWEIDLFGRLKSQQDSKQQSYFAAVESAKAGRISLLAEASIAYITLAADRSRLAIAKDTMETSQKAMDLTEQLVGGGTSNRNDYWQAATVFEQARGDVAALTAAIAQDRNALELLAGGPIDDALLPDGLPEELDWFADVPVGLSSEVLLARPDVLAAEHDLEAANANIGAARAAFFPSLTLTANGGIVSTALAALFTGPTAIWTLVPALSVPLFHGGANEANLALSKAQKDALVAAYEYAVQVAFRETADALATRETIQEQLAAQRALVEASQKSLDLSKERYKAGIDPFLQTLVSARALYVARGSYVSTQLEAMANRVTLYRVLGGDSTAN